MLHPNGRSVLDFFFALISIEIMWVIPTEEDIAIFFIKSIKITGYKCVFYSSELYIVNLNSSEGLFAKGLLLFIS